MRICDIFIIALLPGLVLCSSFEWTASFTEIINDQFRSVTSVTSPTGHTHIFMSDYNRQGIFYQRLLPTGDLTGRASIAPYHTYSPKPDLSAKGCDNGTHLLLAYHKPRGSSSSSCDDAYRSGCFEIYFTESFTGGDTWTSPIRMNRTDMNDPVQRYSPSLTFEKNTGRVYIAYKRNNILAIAVREPGDTTFGPEKYFLDKNNIYSMYLDHTIDSADSKAHLHLVWYFESPRALYHTKSIDGGQTWTNDVRLVEGITSKDPPAVAIDTQASEGRIYVQYLQGRELRMIWSKNHGKKWDGPFKVENTMNGLANTAMCGLNGTGLIFSVGEKIQGEPGFVRYMDPSHKSAVWEKIQYPFPEVSSVSHARYPEVSCAYTGNDTYLLTLQVRNLNGNLYYLARGTLALNKTTATQ